MTDSYSMHNNSTPLHMHHSIYLPLTVSSKAIGDTQTQKVGCKLLSKLTIKAREKEKNHTLIAETPAHTKKVTLTGWTLVNKASSYLRDIPKKAEC